ncbi:MAG TPA: serine/threonine-protein kinase [Kofleriaceae bacterium]|jgi:serine/threonine protein kinase
MPELPTTFGKYFLTEKLATGGMAEIYLAKIVGPGGFEKQVVIKQIHPKLSGQRHFVDLFVAEAKTLVTLAHGNIVPVYELGVVDDTYFIAMDYIDGPTLYRLTEMLSRREARMEPAVAAWITARILEGLDYAHRKGEGVIHRDLSPRNVMLSRDGEVKLVDFGIAVTLGDAGEDDSAQSAPTGSFPYMSPEQVRKEQLTGQTDLFSVGVLAWEMLCGSRLFARQDPDDTLRAVTEGEIPRPSSLHAEIPTRLDEIVLRALERDKTARWADAAEMLAALNKYLYSLDDTPGPRDVSALVARYCPPETRRIPTHADPMFHEEAAEASSGPLATSPTDVRVTDGELATPAAGPHTAVIPRDAAAPRGRPQTRQESFATHVQLKAIIERGTPILGIEAIVDEPVVPDDVDTGPQTKVAPPKTAPPKAEAPDDDPGSTMRVRTSRAGRQSETADPVDDEDRILTREEYQELKAKRSRENAGKPPSRATLIIAGIGAFGACAAAYYVFEHGKTAVLAKDDAGLGDASIPVTDDATIVFDAPEADSPVEIDARELTIDAAPAMLHDAGPASDARIVVRDASLAAIDAAPKPDASLTRPAGTATLVIGANPWGEVYIDGEKQRLRAPNTFTVPAGKHAIEVVFPEDEPPKKQAFTVDLGTDARQEVFADFTKK